uniref:protein-L-isoaspartate(D-aspartate) O-methyltransferase n=2 Tax=Cacopsylla melanoneura TaxID=428564 RepID=A0A8D8LW27_9HEMI
MSSTLFASSLLVSLVVSSVSAFFADEHQVREYEDWRHESNDEMIQALKQFNHIQSPQVESVMRSIDRRRFIERPIMNNPYWDIPQSLGFGSVMSSPKVHAQALEILKEHLKPGARVLDIGSGSGYLTACMAHMVGPKGKVYAVEHIEDLVEQANRTMHTYYPNLMEHGRVEFVAGDGREGHKEGAPYDVIYVGGAVHYYPFKMMNQTKENGIALFATDKWLHSMINHGMAKFKRKNHSRSSLHKLCSRVEQIELSKKENLTEEIAREEGELIFTRFTTTGTTIVEYYEDETGTTYNPLRKHPLPERFNYDWLLNYTDASRETENTMFEETMNYDAIETKPGTYHYHDLFGSPDDVSIDVTYPPGLRSSELSDWEPSNETLNELHNISRLMPRVTFNTDYYEVDGVKYTPAFEGEEVNVDNITMPDWYRRFQEEEFEKWTLPTVHTSKKWRWMVSRDKERARLSSLGLLTPWPTTTRFTGNPFYDNIDSYFTNDEVLKSNETDSMYDTRKL